MDSLIQKFGQKFCKDTVPDLQAGQIVKVHQKIKEGNKERVQIFQGTVIAVNPGSGVNSTFTVRKISEGVGVEKVFPIHSSHVVKVEVLRAQKVRRAKLNFLRELSGKALRLQEIPLELQEKLLADANKKRSEKSRKVVAAPKKEKKEEMTPEEKKPE